VKRPSLPRVRTLKPRSPSWRNAALAGDLFKPDGVEVGGFADEADILEFLGYTAIVLKEYGPANGTWRKGKVTKRRRDQLVPFQLRVPCQAVKDGYRLRVQLSWLLCRQEGAAPLCYAFRVLGDEWRQWGRQHNHAAPEVNLDLDTKAVEVLMGPNLAETLDDAAVAMFVSTTPTGPAQATRAVMELAKSKGFDLAHKPAAVIVRRALARVRGFVAKSEQVGALAELMKRDPYDGFSWTRWKDVVDMDENGVPVLDASGKVKVTRALLCCVWVPNIKVAREYFERGVLGGTVDTSFNTNIFGMHTTDLTIRCDNQFIVPAMMMLHVFKDAKDIRVLVASVEVASSSRRLALYARRLVSRDRV